MNDVIVCKKGVSVQVSKYFQSHEFDCHCSRPDCTETRISRRFLEKADAFREECGCPVIVRSGYRCARWQQSIREAGTQKTAEGPSTHERGEGGDFFTGRHTGLELEAKARKVGFRAVGVAAKWIHADTRGGKDRRWIY